jgi:hypothetical protein
MTHSIVELDCITSNARPAPAKLVTGGRRTYFLWEDDKGRSAGGQPAPAKQVAIGTRRYNIFVCAMAMAINIELDAIPSKDAAMCC